jgi:hypothetical protein
MHNDHKCPRCHGAMEKRFIIDRGEFPNSGWSSCWVSGKQSVPPESTRYRLALVTSGIAGATFTCMAVLFLFQWQPQWIHLALAPTRWIVAQMDFSLSKTHEIFLLYCEANIVGLLGGIAFQMLRQQRGSGKSAIVIGHG